MIWRKIFHKMKHKAAAEQCFHEGIQGHMQRQSGKSELNNKQVVML